MKTQKRIAASVMNCSQKRVIFDSERLEEIKEAITKHDMKQLVAQKAVRAKPVKGVSRGRARKTLTQKRKGRQKNHGSRRGKKNARAPSKATWSEKVRKQRVFIKTLKDKELIDKKGYRELYLKCKGGFFRSQRHIKLYLQEKGVLK